MSYSKVLRKAIETNGIRHQTEKCVEEVGELLQAIIKYDHSKGLEETKANLEHLQEEIADCCIMLEQMKMMYGETEITQKILEKADRLEKRLDTA